MKVSLFLAEGIQLQSGKLVVPGCLSDQVGIVRTFDAAGRLESEEKLMLDSQKVRLSSCCGSSCVDVKAVVLLCDTDSKLLDDPDQRSCLSLLSSDCQSLWQRCHRVRDTGVFDVTAVLQADVNEFFCHPVLLGDNLYNKDRPKVVPPLRDSEGTKDRDKDKQQSTATAGVDSQPTRVSLPAVWVVVQTAGIQSC